MQGVFAGFDVGKDFCWLAAIDGHGRVLISRRVDNDPEAIESAIADLTGLDADELTVGLDVLGGIAGLLAAMLLDAGLTCLHVPGLAVNRARRATKGGENKSDPRDAKVIAEQVMLRDDLREVELPEELHVAIRLLASHRRVLVADRTATIARLRDLLMSVHPGLERVTDPIRAASLILLARYVTPAELRHAGTARVTAHLIKHGVRHQRAQALAEAAVAAGKAQRVVVVGEQHFADLVRELAAGLLATRQRLVALDAELDELLAAHPDAALIASLPGMGAVLTGELIAACGRINRFTSGDALAAAAGLAPVLTQSGRMRYSRSATGGDRVLKRVFYQSAFCALQRDPASRAFYDRKRAEGKRHHQALIALARRRINVLFAMLRDRRPYQAPTTPQLHLAA